MHENVAQYMKFWKIIFEKAIGMVNRVRYLPLTSVRGAENIILDQRFGLEEKG